jgi:hypothetical protein
VPDFSLKQHDRKPSIAATLTLDGVAVNLTGASVKFIMATAPGATPKVSATAVIVNAATGQVRYDWLSANTDTVGIFDAEWEVTYSDTTKQTFPTLTYLTVNIIADLDNS